MKPAHPHVRQALPHLRELDGVRGIAALLVFFHHVCFVTINSPQWGPGILALRSIFQYGMVGVDIFFVLSGFLITSILIGDRGSSTYYRDFYWKRALRILPLYIVCLLGVFLFIPHSGLYVLFSALFIANFASIFHINSLSPFWSLAVEEQFYLLWPTVVRRRSITSLARWAIAVALGAVLLRFLSAAAGHHNYNLTYLRCDGLAVGALLACRLRQRQASGSRLASDDRYFISALLAGVLLYAAAHLVPAGAHHIAFSAAFTQTGTTLLCGGSIGLLIAHAGSLVFAPLRSRLLIFFGLISYALYMVHIYVLVLYDHLRGELLPGDVLAYTLRLVIVLAITIAISLLSRFAIELPAMSLRSRVLKKPAPEAEIETPLLLR